MCKVVVIAACLFGVSCADAQVTVSFHGATWVRSGADQGFFHAFMCMNTKLNIGVKEDCYRFYPKKSSKAAIGGPGKIGQSDIRRVGPDIVSTSEINVTDEQRTKLFKLVTEWSAKDYELTTNHCIDFVATALNTERYGWRANLIAARQPVNNGQSLDPGKLPRVVGRKRYAKAQGMRRDHHV